MYSLNLDNKDCSFEDLVDECFTLFPKSFDFPYHHQWPDARKLDRPLRQLRKKKLIKGDPKSFFSLTKLGKKKAKDTAATLRQKRLFS